MKILMIAPEDPFTLNNGGKLRVNYLLKGLVKNNNDVVFVTYGEENSDSICHHFGDNFPFRYIKVKKPKRIQRLFDFSNAILRGVPYHFAFYSTDVFKKTIKRLLKFDQFDVCFVEYVWMLDNVNFDNTKAKVVLDTHNVEYKRFERNYRNPNGITKFYLKWIKTYERYCVSKVSIAIACSEVDKYYFEKLGSNINVSVIPNGVDIVKYKDIKDTDSQIISFIGSLDYAPNIEGLKWFVENVWPALKKEKPLVKLQIIGRNPSSHIKLMSTFEDITLNADVPEVMPYLNKTKIIVVPLLSGSGTRLKILEAMASRKAIVTTTVGVEGIDVVNDRHLKISDDPVEFKNSIIELIDSNEEYIHITNESLNLVKNLYDWETIGMDLQKLIK